MSVVGSVSKTVAATGDRGFDPGTATAIISINQKVSKLFPIAENAAIVVRSGERSFAHGQNFWLESAPAKKRRNEMSLNPLKTNDSAK
jgi:hypothetical protein